MSWAFYLFKENAARRKMLRQVSSEFPVDAAKEQLFGYHELLQQGIPLDCNLLEERHESFWTDCWRRLDQFLAPRTGIGLGDAPSVQMHLKRMNRARVVLATNDNVGLPAARLRACRRLRVPLLYVSIGLPERMQMVRVYSKRREDRYRRMLAHVDGYITYGYAEADWIREWLGGNVPVFFLPFGVDTQRWQPISNITPRWDVLSIGADPMRDFELFLEYARQRSSLRFGWITSRDRRAEMTRIPCNMDVQTDVPLGKVMDGIAASRVVVHPVKENTYSGATTTLLQTMAMGKAVAVSRVGAIREGYGFKDGVHLKWMQPGSFESLAAVVDGLLADPDAAQTMAGNARRHVVEHLNWGRYVESLHDILNLGWMKNDK